MGESTAMPDRITIETETLGDYRSMFRLLIDDKVIGQGLTAVQAHILIGDILDRVTVPVRADRMVSHAV
jgi:hypothetical protein